MYSFWQKDAFLTAAEVVIVGAGFAGLWSAYELKLRQPGLKITVLERDSFPGGASVRNAGFACFGSPGEMLADAAAMGEELMWQTVAMRYRGINKLRKVLGDATIDYDPCGGYECFIDRKIFESIAAKMDWLNEGMRQITGAENSFVANGKMLAGLGLKNFCSLITNRLEGGLHSGKAVQALWQKVTGLGVTVLFGCEVSGWESDDGGIRVLVRAGEFFSIKTNKLLFATNAFTAQITNAVTVQPARGQILMTEPVPGLLLKGTFHFNEGFYYWRNLGNRILLGGARNTVFAAENTFDAQSSDTIQQALETFLHHHKVVPEKVKIEYRWAGIMGFTESKRPVIQLLAPNVWAMVACNGMGVALTPVMAEEAASQLLA